MPLRAKFKKALGGNTPSPNDSSSEKPDKSFLSKTAARRPLKGKDGEEWPDNVYKPWEAMPRPKYRGPWNQAHQDKLSAFSFGSSSGRRRSSATARTGSDYSPMGSKLPSRGHSRRNSSISWSSSKGGKARKRPSMGSRQTSGLSQEHHVPENAEEENDLAHVGLSRPHTATRRTRPPKEDTSDDVDGMEGLATQKTATNGNGFLSGFADELENQKTATDGGLFTEEELAQALTASTLRPRRRERE